MSLGKFLLLFALIQHSWADGKSMNPGFANNQVFIYNATRTSQSNPFCNGILVSYNKAIAAARCFYDEKYELINTTKLSVIIGSCDKLLTDIQIKDIIIHDKFVPGQNSHNIAIAVFQKDVFSKEFNIIPAGLATYRVPTGTNCTVFKWSSIEEEHSFCSIHPAEATLIDKKYCYPNQDIADQSVLCAGPYKSTAEEFHRRTTSLIFCHDSLVGLMTTNLRHNSSSSVAMYINIYRYWTWISENGVPEKFDLTNDLYKLFLLIFIIIFL